MWRQYLPEGEEDHHLDHCKLQQGVEGRQELVGAEVEQQQCIQSRRVGKIVNDGDPEIPAETKIP